jgi:hypothetical protein
MIHHPRISVIPRDYLAKRVTARYSQVYDLLCYDGIPREITVHRGFELCGLIAHHSPPD